MTVHSNCPPLARLNNLAIDGRDLLEFELPDDFAATPAGMSG
ncbi:hypothetical protein [Mycobacterium simiae]|nr:hypothetical protein [Mycobacterium simiae]PLV48020.1 hypothetical protein X011_17760 [Mycobacterium tuberculosis variant microti OV254]